MATFCAGCSMAAGSLVPSHVVVACESRLLLEESLRTLDQLVDTARQQRGRGWPLEPDVELERRMERRLEVRARAEAGEVTGQQPRPLMH
eukprot:203648-Hanusia_phi.AAC.1